MFWLWQPNDMWKLFFHEFTLIKNRNYKMWLCMSCTSLAQIQIYYLSIYLCIACIQTVSSYLESSN